MCNIAAEHNQTRGDQLTHKDNSPDELLRLRPLHHHERTKDTDQCFVPLIVSQMCAETIQGQMGEDWGSRPRVRSSGHNLTNVFLSQTRIKKYIRDIRRLGGKSKL